MKLRRFRIRTMTVVVVVVALGFGAWSQFAAIKRRQQQYRSRAAYFTELERDVRYLQDSHLGLTRSFEKSASFYLKMKERYSSPKSQAEIIAKYDENNRLAERERARAEAYTEVIEYTGKMKRKYELAARSPWLPVKPDPPRPSFPSESDGDGPLGASESP